jgi:hypothetical protein
VTDQAAASMKANSDMATHALIWHLMIPGAIALIGLGILRIGWEILKNKFREKRRDHKRKRANRL